MRRLAIEPARLPYSPDSAYSIIGEPLTRRASPRVSEPVLTVKLEPASLFFSRLIPRLSSNVVRVRKLLLQGRRGEGRIDRGSRSVHAVRRSRSRRQRWWSRRSAGEARARRSVHVHLPHHVPVPPQTLQNVHVVDQRARRLSYYLEKVNRLIEQFSQHAFVETRTERGVSTDGIQNQEVAPLTGISLVSKGPLEGNNTR